MSEEAGTPRPGKEPARRRRRLSKDRARPVEPRPERCPNCSTVLADQYCAHCGQNNRAGRLRLGEMLATGFEHLFDLDLPIVRTLIGLTIRPGRVCLDYVEGRRRRYSNPLRYFIMVTAFYVLILFTFDISPSRLFKQSSAGPDTAEAVVAEAVVAEDVVGGAAAPGAAEEAPSAEHAESLTAEKRQAAERRDRSRRIAEYFAENAPRRVEGSLNIIMLLTVPFLALVYWLLFRRPRLTIAEHMVFVLFVYAQDTVISIVAVSAGLLQNIWGMAATQVVSLAYISWAACVFYRTSVITTVLRVLAAFICYMIITMFFGVMYIMMWVAWLFASGEIFERI